MSANAGDGTKANNHAIHWAATFGGHESVKLLCGEQYKMSIQCNSSTSHELLIDFMYHPWSH